MKKKMKTKVSLFVGKLLGKENKGMEGWEILLGALLSVLVIVVLITTFNGSLPGLVTGLVNKFNRTLGL